MAEAKRQSNFQMAYHNVPGEFVLSNGSVGQGHGDLQNFAVHKRAVSSKKIRVNKKKGPSAKGSSGIQRQAMDTGYAQPMH